MTPPSAPMEQPEGMELGGSFNEQRGKHGESHGDQAAGNYAQRVSPMEQGYSPQPLQPHELSMQTTTSILRQQRENSMRIANFVLRCAALLFSFLSFVIMAANKQNNPTMKFDDYEEYRYCLSIGVLAFVYSAFQLFKAIYDIVIGYTIIPEIVSSYMDFICDQGKGNCHQVVVVSFSLIIAIINVSNPRHPLIVDSNNPLVTI
eukprot:Gb_39802 [translate_table: standard]